MGGSRSQKYGRHEIHAVVSAFENYVLHCCRPRDWRRLLGLRTRWLPARSGDTHSASTWAESSAAVSLNFPPPVLSVVAKALVTVLPKIPTVA